jgi:hypothetical protein
MIKSEIVKDWIKEIYKNTYTANLTLFEFLLESEIIDANFCIEALKILSKDKKFDNEWLLDYVSKDKDVHDLYEEAHEERYDI